jgi:hypothetical protein
MQTMWLLALVLTAAQAAPDLGRDIAQKSQTAHFTYKTLTATGEMTLRRGRDVIGQRAMTVELIEQESADGYDQARLTIDAPSALKGTRLLSWSTGRGDDQQWLVTPRSHRVQRIADRGRQAAFVGSDFSYEDILKWQVDDYEYTTVGRGPCPAGTCTVVDARPRNRYSSYALLKVHYDDQYRISKVDYFTAGTDTPRKTLVHTAYLQQGASWQPARSVITDHQRDTSTEVTWSDYRVNVPVDERVMSPTTADR